MGDRPDLIVNNITLPDSITSTKPFSIKWEVKNIGDKTTGTTGFTDRVYWSQQKIFDLGRATNVANYQHNAPIGVNGVSAGSAFVTLNLSAKDSLFFFVITDFSDDVFEKMESNNTLFASVGSKGIPPVVTVPPVITESIVVKNAVDLQPV